MVRGRKEYIMSKMGDFVIECGEELQKRRPELSWEEAMRIITSDNKESREIEAVIYKRRGIDVK